MVKLNMASVVTFHMKLSHIYKGLIIWLALHRALCVLDVTNSDIVKRQWPYPLLPGNFEDLTNNLEQCNKKKQESSTDKLAHSPTLKQIATSLAENKTVNLAAVYDDVLSQKSMLTLQMYGSIAADWRFSQSESMPWSTWLNSTVVNSTEVNKVFSTLVGDIKQNTKEYYPYETTLHILRRGDSVGLIQGDSEEVILIYFLKDDWQINSYGELNLYKGEEIEMSVKPSFNRAIVWNGSLAYLPKSPSMNCEGSLYFLMIKYTGNMTKVDLFEARRLHHIEEKKNAERNMFHSMMDINGHYGNIDVANHVTKDYTGTNGRKIYVFDDLFLRDDLLNLRNHVEDYGDYYFDDSYDEDSDNVQWISAINIELFIKSRLWKVVQRIAEFVSGVSTWYPYDIACNNIRAFDSTQNHQDCETWEDEWTFLLYLNPNWTIDYGGETAFYSDSEKLEYITSIRPKYGRAVIFEGIIPHSARPPSSVHLGPRFTCLSSYFTWMGETPAVSKYGIV
ncbi:hypothetical protein BSL78_08216 [Apostichopus japonicus]|uniref:Prolyl 4-hydroxylase alpha subunit Fe(2+) 2OG dioxygenase domain-containing protein n=1 Tax=Stichopus japonicus TaxID=307972 RepID=A0A2G8L3N5_STIJA|nr:hypothetical protein BSL78_08216 [Apostichopus japonicus]